MLLALQIYGLTPRTIIDRDGPWPKSTNTMNTKEYRLKLNLASFFSSDHVQQIHRFRST